MSDVAIVGAGELGGTIAYVLARRDVARRIRLVDETGGVAAGKALDIQQAAAIHGFATTVEGTTEIDAVGNGSILIVADCASRGEWSGEEGLTLLRRLGTARPRVTICAGATQRDLVERGVRELAFSRARLLGSAPEALASAIRACVALETNGSVKDVALTVLGIPPDRIVVPWEDATIGGIRATRVLDEPALRRLAARVSHLWPPAGAYALAAAAAKAVEAILGKSRESVSCFVGPDDSMGRRARTVAAPVRLGQDGIVSVDVPSLTGHDRVAFDNAVLL